MHSFGIQDGDGELRIVSNIQLKTQVLDNGDTTIESAGVLGSWEMMLRAPNSNWSSGGAKYESN